jgi:hypothetical protein
MRTVSTLAALVAVGLLPASVRADGPARDLCGGKTSGGAEDESADDDTVDGFCLTSGRTGEGDSPRPDAPVCHWLPVPASTVRSSTIVDATSQVGDGANYFRLLDGGIGRTLPNGRTEKGAKRYCDNGSVSDLTWLAVTTLQDLINGATISASRKIPVPQLAVNPAPEHGGIVNFGMWLALGNPQPISVQAGIGNVWARTTAEITSTMWEMGNGDTVHCDGPGTPLTPDDPGWNDTAQGPCGYTYTEKPPPEPYHVTVTATWTVTWTTSTGTTGTANPITRSTTFDYDVGEIQTIGVSG